MKRYTVNEKFLNRTIIVLANVTLALVVITSIVKGW